MSDPGQGGGSLDAEPYVDGTRLKSWKLATALAGSLITLFATVWTALLSSFGAAYVGFFTFGSDELAETYRVLLGGLADPHAVGWANVLAFIHAHPMLAPLVVTIVALATAWVMAKIWEVAV